MDFEKEGLKPLGLIVSRKRRDITVEEYERQKNLSSSAGA